MLEVTGTITAPAPVVWRLLTDTQSWPQWSPSVRAVDVPQRFIASGMRGRVQTPPGLGLPFHITAWEEGHSWRWAVAGIPATGHVVSPMGPVACRLSFTIPAWAPFYLPVCRAALGRLTRLANADITPP